MNMLLNSFLLLNSLFLATDASRTNINETQQLIVLVISFIALILILIFAIILPDRKKKKAQKNMLLSLKVGAKVTTKSGIVGNIVKLHDDSTSIILVTGRNKQEIEVERDSILDVLD